MVNYVFTVECRQKITWVLGKSDDSTEKAAIEFLDELIRILPHGQG